MIIWAVWQAKMRQQAVTFMHCLDSGLGMATDLAGGMVVYTRDCLPAVHDLLKMKGSLMCFQKSKHCTHLQQVMMCMLISRGNQGPMSGCSMRSRIGFPDSSEIS